MNSVESIQQLKISMSIQVQLSIQKSYGIQSERQLDKSIKWDHIGGMSDSESPQQQGQKKIKQQKTQIDITNKTKDISKVSNSALYVYLDGNISIHDISNDEQIRKKKDKNLYHTGHFQNSSILNLNKCSSVLNVRKNEKNQALEQNSSFDHVFQEGTKQKKNTNFAKILVSNFEKYIRKSRIQISKEHTAFLSRAKKLYTRRGLRNIKIQALSALFGGNSQHQQFTKTNRLLLFNFLGSIDFKIESIFQSRSMKRKNRKQHLLATKIYRLRCRSKQLTERVQTK